MNCIELRLDQVVPHIRAKLKSALGFDTCHSVVCCCIFFSCLCYYVSCVPLFDSLSSSALASLADDVIPIDTGAVRWESQTFLAQVPHE